MPTRARCRARAARPFRCWSGSNSRYRVRPSVAVQKSASFSRRVRNADFLNQSHTRSNKLLVSFDSEVRDTSMPQKEANFGIGTLKRIPTDLNRWDSQEVMD